MTSKSRLMALLSAMVLFSATALVGCNEDKAATTEAAPTETAAPATTEAAPAAAPEAPAAH